MTIKVILFSISFGFLIGGDRPSENEVAQLKYANTKVWLKLKNNPDAHFYDWRGVDLKILGEQTDLLHLEIMQLNPDPRILDRDAWEVWYQQYKMNRRNYTKKIEKPQPSKITINYFSASS